MKTYIRQEDHQNFHHKVFLYPHFGKQQQDNLLYSLHYLIPSQQILFRFNGSKKFLKFKILQVAYETLD
jgi:hypothetical protein